MSIIIRLQNLSWSANSLDIRRFFEGLSIPEGGVHIVGGEKGDAFIAFGSDEDARQAMEKSGTKLKDLKIKLMLSSRAEMQRVIEQARTPALVPAAVVTVAAASPPPSSAPKETASSRDHERSKKSPEKRRSDRTSREKSRDRERSSKKTSRRSRSRSPRRTRDKERDSDRRSKRDDRRKSEEHTRPKEEPMRSDPDGSRRQVNSSVSQSGLPTGLPDPLFPSARAVVPSNLELKPPGFAHGFDSNQRVESSWGTAYNAGVGAGDSSKSQSTTGNRSGYQTGPDLYNPNRTSSFDLDKNRFPDTSFNSKVLEHSSSPFPRMQGKLSNTDYDMASSTGDRMGTDMRNMPNVRNPIDSRNLSDFRGMMDSRGLSESGIPGNRPASDAFMPGMRPLTNTGMPPSNMNMTDLGRISDIGIMGSHSMQDVMGMGSNARLAQPDIRGMSDSRMTGDHRGMQDPRGMVAPRNVLDSRAPDPRNVLDSRVPDPRNILDSRGQDPRNILDSRASDPRNVLDPRGPDPRNILDPRGPDPRNILDPRGPDPRSILDSRGPDPRNLLDSRGPDPRNLLDSRGPDPRNLLDSRGPDPRNILDSRGPDARNISDSRVHDPRNIMDSRVPDPRNNLDSRMLDPRNILDSRAPDPRNILDSRAPDQRNILDSRAPDPRNILDSRAPDPRNILDPRAPDPRNMFDPRAPDPRNMFDPRAPDPRSILDSRAPDSRSIFDSRAPDPRKDSDARVRMDSRGLSDSRGTGISDTRGIRDPRGMPTSREMSDSRRMPESRGLGQSRELPDSRGTHHSRELSDSRSAHHSRDVPSQRRTDNSEHSSTIKKNVDEDQKTCIEMKALPLFVVNSDIRDFFQGITIPSDGIKIINNEKGQRTGIAYVRFNSERDRFEGLKRTGNRIDTNSVTLGRVSYKTFKEAVDSFLPPGMEPPGYGRKQVEEMCIMMKGLPFMCKEEDIAEFFNGIRTVDMFIEYDVTGRQRGTAFVEFPTSEDVKAAMTRNGKLMGRRYIELIVAAKETMQSVRAQMIPEKSNVPPLVPPEPLPTNCLAVRGLPCNVVDRQLADFFGEGGFVPHAIHMMLGPTGNPTGDAYIEFNNPRECEAGLKRNGHLFGNQPIELSPIPYKDMMNVLNSTGGPPQPDMQHDKMQGLEVGQNIQGSKPLMGSPILNTPRGPPDSARPVGPDSFHGPPDSRGAPEGFLGHPDGHRGIPEGPRGLPDGPRGLPDGPRGLPDGPRGLPDGPRGLPDGPLGLPDGPRGLPDGPRGLPDGPRGHPDGPRGLPDGPRGHPDGPRGHPDGPRGHPDGPRGHLDGTRGHPDGPRGHPDGPRGHPDGPRGHLDGPRGHPDGPRGYPDGPRGRPDDHRGRPGDLRAGPDMRGPMSGPPDSLLGPMEPRSGGSRVGLLDSVRGRPLLDEIIDRGRPPLLDSRDRMMMNPRGPLIDGPPGPFGDADEMMEDLSRPMMGDMGRPRRHPDGKHNGRPLLDLDEMGHFMPDDHRMHDERRMSRYGDHIAGPDDHPDAMGHRFPPGSRGSGPKPYRGRGAGPGMGMRNPGPPAPSGPEGFGHPGCVVGATNIPWHATMDDILLFFDGFGLNQDSVIRRYDSIGRTTADARICFHTPEDAQRALNELNGVRIDGRPVSLFMP